MTHEEPQPSQEVPQRACGLCLSSARLVDSHIFPKWMGKEIRNDGPLLSIPTHTGSLPRFVHRHGEYDQIVCDPCEQSFGKADDYFLDFYRARGTGRLVSKGPAKAQIFTGWDQALIQRFFLTCLFRAHLSSRHGFERVELGSYGDRLRVALRETSGTAVPCFDVVLLRETHPLSMAITIPTRAKMEGTNTFRLDVPGFAAIVRVDQRPLPSPLAGFALGVMPDIWAPEFNEVHPKQMDAMVRAKFLHGSRIDRMISPKPKKPKAGT